MTSQAAKSAPQRPQNPLPPLQKRPRRERITLKLPEWSCSKGLFSMELIVRPEHLTTTAAKAMDSRDGRVTLAGGAIVVVMRRVGSTKACKEHGQRGCRVQACKAASAAAATPPTSPAGGEP
jgi:hypothetical protein